MGKTAFMGTNVHKSESFFFCLLLLFGPISAKSLIEQIGWEGATTQIIISVTIILTSLLVIMIALYIRNLFKIKKDQEDVSNKLFNEHSRKADLYPSEVKRLKQLLSHEMIPHPHTIFQSALLFERCIDAEVRLLIITKSDPDLLEEDEKILSGIRKKLGYGYLPLEHPLLSTRNIEIGQTLSIFRTTGNTPLIKHAILIMNKETFFRLQYDTEQEEEIRFFEGQELKLAFARQGDGMYGLQVEIWRSAPPSTIDFFHTLKFRRNQLRQFARIEVNLPIRVRTIPSEKPAGAELFPKHVEAKLSDLSGGGLSFLHEKPLVPGDRVSMQFNLSTGKFSGITGKVLRVSLQEGKTKNLYRHHVEFTDIEQQYRDRIVKYIFEKQRQQNQMR